MVSVYKRIYALYWGIGLILAISEGFFSYYFPDYAIFGLFVLIALVFLEGFLFIRLSNRIFAKEVMSKFLTCHVHEYMDLLDKRLEKKKRRDLKSTYNYLKGMGYSALDDYDSLYECAQQVTHLSHQSEYYKRLIDYYIYKDMFIEAQDLMIKLAELNAKVKSKVYKDSIDVSLKLFDCRIKVKTGNYAGVEECYTQMLSSHETAVLSLISKVSISYALGELLVKKGEKERAKEHLKFASEKGGDTKYKIFADRLLSEIEEEAVPFA